MTTASGVMRPVIGSQSCLSRRSHQVQRSVAARPSAPTKQRSAIKAGENVHAAEAQASPEEADDAQQQMQQLLDNLQHTVSVQRQQIQQLTRDKQQMQQQAKQQAKEQAKLQDKLQTAQQQLSQLQYQHATVTLELLQVKAELEAAQLRVIQLSQADALGSSEADESCWDSSSSGTDDDSTSPYSPPAASNGNQPLRIAFVGGKDLKDSYRAMLPPDAEVRHFGSSRDMGAGEISRLKMCLKQGSIDEVYMITRWNGHCTTQQVTKLCKLKGIPVRLLDSSQIARAKGQAAAGM